MSDKALRELIAKWRSETDLTAGAAYKHECADELEAALASQPEQAHANLYEWLESQRVKLDERQMFAVQSFLVMNYLAVGAEVPEAQAVLAPTEESGTSFDELAWDAQLENMLTAFLGTNMDEDDLRDRNGIVKYVHDYAKAYAAGQRAKAEEAGTPFDCYYDPMTLCMDREKCREVCQWPLYKKKQLSRAGRLVWSLAEKAKELVEGMRGRVKRDPDKADYRSAFTPIVIEYAAGQVAKGRCV